MVFWCQFFFHFPLAKSGVPYLCKRHVVLHFLHSHTSTEYYYQVPYVVLQLNSEYYELLSNQKLYPNDRATQRRINHHLITSTARGIIVVQSRKTTLYITKAVLNHRRQNKSRKRSLQNIKRMYLVVCDHNR